MFVSMWMSTEVMTTHPRALLADIAEVMGQQRIRRLPVMKSPNDPTLVGIVSARDVLHACPVETNPFGSYENSVEATQKLRQIAVEVADVMTADPLTTTPDAPIEAVAELMRERKIGALPVMHHDRLVGLITESDIFGAFASMFGAVQSGARITFDISQGEDVFPLIAELVTKHRLRVVSLVSLHAHRQPMCVVNVAGSGIDGMLEDVWKSHHKVKHVLRR
jgi:acetoin utilization protein AcuB